MMEFIIQNAYADAVPAGGAPVRPDLIIGELILLLLVGITIYYGYRNLKKSIARKSKNRNSPYTIPLGENTQRTEGEQYEGVSIFISYRRDDSIDIVGRIYDRLTDKYGNSRMFKDVDSIPIGADFREHIKTELENTSTVLVVIGKNWTGVNGSGRDSIRRIDEENDYMRLEIATALNNNIPVIPIKLLGGEIPSENKLPNDIQNLAYRNGITVRPDPDFNNDINRLIAGLDKMLLTKPSSGR